MVIILPFKKDYDTLNFFE